MRSEQLTPHMIRVVLGGSGFDTFTPSEFTDAYVKIVIVADDVDVGRLPHPLTLDSFNDLPDANQPVVRTYTVRRPTRAPARSPSTSSCTAITGRPARGQRRQTRPTGIPDGPERRLRAGPRRRLASAGRRRGRAAGDQRRAGSVARQRNWPSIHRSRRARRRGSAHRPDGVEVRWIYRGGRADLVGEDRAGDYAPLVAAVKEAQWLPGQVQVFMHGEAQAVMHNLRPYIRKERGVDAKWASISGYWRRGRTEETFRQWKAELAAPKAGSQ